MTTIETTKFGDGRGITVRGYHILVALPMPKEVTDGGIIIPDETKDAEMYNTSVGKVLQIGAAAFKQADSGEFAPTGPRCEIGDWVICPKFGTKIIEVDGYRYSIVNDDEIYATIDDPHRMKAYL